LPSVRAAQGSILFLPVPIEQTIEHVIQKLPSDYNMNIIVEGTTRYKFSKGVLCNVEKVRLLFFKLFSNILR